MLFWYRMTWKTPSLMYQVIEIDSTMLEALEVTNRGRVQFFSVGNFFIFHFIFLLTRMISFHVNITYRI